MSGPQTVRIDETGGQAELQSISTDGQDRSDSLDEAEVDRGLARRPGRCWAPPPSPWRSTRPAS